MPSELALVRLRPIQPTLSQLRLPLELAETPCAGESRTVRLRSVEPVTLTGMSRLSLELDEAEVQASARGFRRTRIHRQVPVQARDRTKEPLADRLSARGAPRPKDGSRVKISVATSVSRSWLLTNEPTRWRVRLTTAATTSRL
jgi:hypothetical protein